MKTDNYLFPIQSLYCKSQKRIKYSISDIDKDSLIRVYKKGPPIAVGNVHKRISTAQSAKDLSYLNYEFGKYTAPISKKPIKNTLREKGSRSWMGYII